MTMYQPGIPTGTLNLDVDYKNIQNNFSQLNTTYGTDHVAYDQALNNGFHNVIREVPFSTTASNPPKNQPVAQPTATAGINTTFSAQINDGNATDTVLYNLTAGNLLQQLTSNFQPTVAIKGATFLPGGLIMQWGTIANAVSQTDIAVTFTGVGGVGVLNFPKNIFGVWTNMQNNSPTNSVNVVYTFTYTNTGFHYRNTSSGTQTFNWIALGN